MEVGHIVFRCGTALDKVKVRVLIDNNQRMLELACARRIQAEIRLQRDFHGNPLRHIDKRTAGPDGSVQCGKFVVGRFHQFHKVFPHHIRVLTMQRTLHIGIDNTLRRNFRADVVIDQLRIILCAHTGERFPLCLRNAETLKRIFDVIRHIGPLCFHFRIRADIRYDVIHVQTLNRRTPVRNRHLVVDL